LVLLPLSSPALLRRSPRAPSNTSSAFSVTFLHLLGVVVVVVVVGVVVVVVLVVVVVSTLRFACSR
jgi:hypothetical protein